MKRWLMTHSYRKALLLVVGGVGVVVVALSVMLSPVVTGFKNPLASNLETTMSRQFPHNYIFFQNRQGEPTQTITEVNGWLLLEAWLMKLSGEAWSPHLQKAIEAWPSDQLSGWWPADVMAVGRRYLKKEEALVLSPDIDDSIWRWILANYQPTDAQMAVFLPKMRAAKVGSAVANMQTAITNDNTDTVYDSDGLMNANIHTDIYTNEDIKMNAKMVQLCQRHDCNQSESILRVWINPEWQDDWDMIAIANAVAYFRPQSEKMKNSLRDSKKLINQLIRTKEYSHYFHYYEPKIAGTALLLLYHYYGNHYLDPDNEAILLKEYQFQKNELKGRPLISRWGGGAEGGDEEDWIGGYNLVTVNTNISRLLIKVLDSKITNHFPPDTTYKNFHR